MPPLTRAYATLIGVSLCTTVLAKLADDSGPVLVATVLALSGWKARLILNDYLKLRTSRFWRRGLNAIVSMFLILSFGIYLVPRFA